MGNRMEFEGKGEGMKKGVKEGVVQRREKEGRVIEKE